MPRPDATVASSPDESTPPNRRSLLGLLADSRSAMVAEQAMTEEGSKPKRVPDAQAGLCGAHGGCALVAQLEGTDAASAEHRPESSAMCWRCLRGSCGKDGGTVLRCIHCSDTVHRKCLHPLIPDRVCRTELASAWTCDTCAQEQHLLGNPVARWHPFCMACESGKGGRRRVSEHLVSCSSCRASYHRDCCDCPRGRGLLRWSCSSCSELLNQRRVHLSMWSLELVPQRNGRTVPVVRGVRDDEQGPPGMLWRSSEIIHAMTPTSLVTRSRMTVQLSGPLSKRLAAKLQLPRHLRDKFKLGFPVQSWMPLVRYAYSGPPANLEAALGTWQPAKIQPPSSLQPLQDEEAAGAQASKSCGSRAGTAQKRPRSAGAEGEWTDEDTLRLKKVLGEIRPSTPHFWEQVARRVGRSSEECQEHAFGPARSPARRQTSGPAPIADAGGRENCDDGPAPLPKKDGPRREQRINAFLEARSFGRGDDMLDMPAEGAATAAAEAVTPSRNLAWKGGEQEGGENPAADPWPAEQGKAAEAPSPGCMDFFKSLHTGCTPVPKARRRSGGQQDPAAAPGPGRPQSDLFESDPATCQSLLDFGDCSWKPKGVESFICETRAKRGRLARTGRVNSKRPGSPARPMRAANLRRAQALFSKLDGRTAAVNALDSTPRSVASDSEDEGAPLAVIPPPPAPDYQRGLMN